MDRKIILFELNEVPFRIVEQFCAWQPRSCLARLLPGMRKIDTFAEDVAPLSPWITWPTVHRGVDDTKHGILNFGQELSEVDEQYPPVWRILANNGIRVGVCGSLHSYPLPDDVEKYSFFIPDTFAAGSECFPKYVSLFQDFNLRMARDSARNVSKKIPWSSAWRVLANAPGLGLKLETFADAGFQLLSERFKQCRRVRRRTYQAVLAFDVFMKQLENTRPDFATFFTNHVASSMHRYWAAAFPGDYPKFGYEGGWVKTYCHEIDWTMQKADALLSRLVRFTARNPDYQIWISTSMGQAATEAEPVRTQLYITDVPQFMKEMGVEGSQWEKRPSMLPDYCFRIAPEKALKFKRKLSTLRVAGELIRVVESTHGFYMFSLGQVNLDDAGGVELDGVMYPYRKLGLENTPIQDTTNTNAYHIPQGCLLIYDPRDLAPKPARTQISTQDIAPTLLRNFAVKPPEYMKAAVNL